jgi:transposase
MSQVIMVGCDLHAKTLVLKLAVDRSPSELLRLPNSPSGRERLIGDLRQREAKCGGARVIVAYEASGQGFGLHDELRNAGFECHVLAPTKMARSVHQVRNKGDEQDAEQILDLLRGHILAGTSLPAVWIPDRLTRDDRELVRTRLDAAEKIAGLKTQVKSLLARNQLTRSAEVGKGWTKLLLAWLRGLKDHELGSGGRLALASLLRQWESHHEELKRLDEAVGELACSPRYAASVAALTELSGVGVLGAMVFLTEMGDLRRFANRRQVAAYLGLVPSRHESGARNDCKGHITGHGSARVRKMLCQASWTRMRAAGADHDTYARLVAKNPKHKKIAVVALMRRLAIRLWHAGRKQSPAQAAAPWGKGPAGPPGPFPQTPNPLPLFSVP